MLLYFGVVLTPLTGSLTVSNVASLPSSFLRDSAGNFAALLGVPPANLYAVNLTDVATGASLQVGSVRRQLGGLGSLGVRVTFVVRLGKTPSEALVTNMSSVLASPAACAGALRAVATSLGAASGLGAAAYAASVPAAGIALANSPFILSNTVVVAAAAADGSGGAAAATGGIVGGIVCALALACGVWAFRSYSKHKTLPCCRDRRSELLAKQDVGRAIAEAEAVLEASAPAPSPGVAAVPRPGKPKPKAAAAQSALIVRKLAQESAAAKAEVAALRKQLAAAKHGGGGGGEEAERSKDEEVAELRRLLAAATAQAKAQQQGGEQPPSSPVAGTVNPLVASFAPQPVN